MAVNQLGLSCLSSFPFSVPDFCSTFERTWAGSPSLLLGVVLFGSTCWLGVKPLDGRVGTVPSSMLSCCWSSLSEKLSEWNDNLSLLDPGTKSFSTGITAFREFTQNHRKTRENQRHNVSEQSESYCRVRVATIDYCTSDYPLLQPTSNSSAPAQIARSNPRTPAGHLIDFDTPLKTRLDSCAKAPELQSDDRNIVESRADNNNRPNGPIAFPTLHRI